MKKIFFFALIGLAQNMQGADSQEVDLEAFRRKCRGVQDYAVGTSAYVSPEENNRLYLVSAKKTSKAVHFAEKVNKLDKQVQRALFVEENNPVDPFDTLIYFIARENKSEIKKFIKQDAMLLNKEKVVVVRNFNPIIDDYEYERRAVTPLVYAILQGKASIVKLLIDLGANPKQKCGGFSPKMFISLVQARTLKQKKERAEKIERILNRAALAEIAKASWEKEKAADTLKRKRDDFSDDVSSESAEKKLKIIE